MSEPIEDLIRSLPLKQTSQQCDRRVHEILGAEPKHSGQEKTSFEAARPPRKGSLIVTLIATAASLLVGFYLGTWFEGKARPALPLGEPESPLTNQLAGFELGDHVEVVDGGSTTVIVGDSVELQNNVPVRKFETVTRKKIRVRDKKDETGTEMEIPIRKVFYAPAETI